MRAGFSLTELLVVIAIVAVLSAIAVPVYQKYIIAANLRSVANIIEGLVQQSIVFAGVNGRFPEINDLGLGSGGGGSNGYAQQLFGKYYQSYQNGGYLSIFDADSPYGPSCGRAGVVQYYPDPATTLGFGNTAAGGAQVVLTCIMWNDNKVINTFCYYNVLFNGHIPQHGDFLPGWTNPADVNLGTTGAHGGVAPYVNIPPNYVSSQCM